MVQATGVDVENSPNDGVHGVTHWVINYVDTKDKCR